MAVYTLVTSCIQILGSGTAIIAICSRRTSEVAVYAFHTGSVKILGCSTTVIAISA